MDERISATLIILYRGYRNIELLKRIGNKWLAQICGSGLEIEVYDDEFTVK
ncbi:hypothetical protein [Viscerimonas tarda]